MVNKDLKFIVDVGVSLKVEKWLQEIGCDIKAVRNINPKMTDNEILKIAASEKRMVITMDKDFGELVFNSKRSHAGVLLLRLEDADSDEKLKIVKNIMEKYYNLIENNFCVFKNGKLRIKSAK